MFLRWGLFSGDLLGVSCSCCRPALLIPRAGGEEPLKRDGPDCSALKPGGVLDKADETAELFSLLGEVSTEALMELDAFSLELLPEEPQVLPAEEADLSHAPVLSEGGLTVEACSAPTDLLEKAHGRGIELLFESLLCPGDDALERDAVDNLALIVFSSLPSFSAVLVGFF